ncbi:MAG: phosphoenolpyruvate carboxykinase [Culicoidibacterales bacterium]
MSFAFEMGRNSAIANFTRQYCQTETEVLASEGFNKVLTSYLTWIEKRQTRTYQFLTQYYSPEEIGTELHRLFKLLLVFEACEIRGETYQAILAEKHGVIEVIEEFYDYWRSLERYAVIYNSEHRHTTGLQARQFLETNTDFANLILSMYRQIEETIQGHHHQVYRQLIAGVNAGMIVHQPKTQLPEQYAFLEQTAMIESVVLHPPFITYPAQTTRNGLFNEVTENPLHASEYQAKQFFCFPVKVGSLLAFVYFHRDFMAQGITLANLFEIATPTDTATRKPDLIYVYGMPETNGQQACFYHDQEEAMYFGYTTYNEAHDYFGYMKKMLLTLHNVAMINQGKLPLHGAMAQIEFFDGKQANVVIIGDSGAGKSETLEALRTASEGIIRQMTIMFDDMGTLQLDKEGNIVATGTEIGAFVRLDDLDTGYAYRQIDRSVFMNPDKVNARLVIPIATYKEIMTPQPIDLFLYANNYEHGEALDFFTDVASAQDVFVAGARMAKGTTQEVGLVKSYFANPFGPVQRQEQTDGLLDQYFTALFDQDIQIGQIRTELGFAESVQTGPAKAAQALLTYLQNK